MHPITAIKIFMFFFVGGLVGLGAYMVGAKSSAIPLIILLAGTGALACVEMFLSRDQTRR